MLPFMKSFTTPVRTSLVRALLVAVATGTPNGGGALASDPPIKPIKTVRRLEDTIHRFGGYGDNWHMSWADNDKV
jgi:hypothetical protein